MTTHIILASIFILSVLLKKAYQDSEISGKHYEAYVKFVEQLKIMEGMI